MGSAGRFGWPTTEHYGNMLQLQMSLIGRLETSNYSTSMLREPRSVDPMPP